MNIPSPKPGDAGADERGWLIELRGSIPSWWALDASEGEGGWTTDSLKALRFGRKVDADAYIADAGWTEAFATEHMWTVPRTWSGPSSDPKDILIRELTALLLRTVRRHVPKDHADYAGIGDYVNRKNLASPLRSSEAGPVRPGVPGELVERLRAHECGCAGECGTQTPSYIREAADALTASAARIGEVEEQLRRTRDGLFHATMALAVAEKWRPKDHNRLYLKQSAKRAARIYGDLSLLKANSNYSDPVYLTENYDEAVAEDAASTLSSGGSNGG